MIESLPIHTPNTQYPSSGSGGDITSEEDKSNIKIENDEQEFSPVYDEQEDEVNSAFYDEGNDLTIDIPDIPIQNNSTDVDVNDYEKDKIIKMMNQLRLEKAYLVKSVIRLSSQADEEQNLRRKERESYKNEIRLLKLKCEAYSNAQNSLENKIKDILTETVSSYETVSSDETFAINSSTIEKCIQSVKETFKDISDPVAFQAESSQSSEESLDIFINDCNLNNRPNLENNQSPSKSHHLNSFRPISNASYGNLIALTSSSNHLSPSTHSLASHISLDSLRRRAMMDTRICADDDDDDDNASIVSSISTHRETGLISPKKTKKTRKVCICGAVKSKKSLTKPSSYRYYDEDGKCIVHGKFLVPDSNESLESLEAYSPINASVSSPEKSQITTEESVKGMDGSEKKSSFWGFFKI